MAPRSVLLVALALGMSRSSFVDTTALIMGAMDGRNKLAPAAAAFHAASSGPRPQALLAAEGVELDWDPGASKSYAGASGVDLPEWTATAKPLEEVILSRESRRGYSGESIPLAQISMMLNLGYGVVRKDGGDFARRVAPSAGGLYPLEMYLFSFRVEGLPGGLFHYQRDRHRLEQLNAFDRRTPLGPIFGDLVDFSSMSALMVISAVFSRSTRKYGDRGYRFALLEAGHLAQNLLLTAEGLRLGAVPLGGFHDDMVNRLLGVDGEAEAAVHAVAIGGRCP